METTTKAMPENETRPSVTEAPRAPLPASTADLQARPSRRRDPRFRIFLIAGLIVLAIVGFFVWRYLGSYESTDDAQIDGHVNSIRARVLGHVIKINVQENQYVDAGTVLVEIDPTDYQVAVQRAQADYNDAKATADAAAVDCAVPGGTHTSNLS